MKRAIERLLYALGEKARDKQRQRLGSRCLARAAIKDQAILI